MKAHDISAAMRRAEKQQEAARRRAEEVRRRQAEEEVAAAELRRYKLEREAVAEKARQEALAERQQRIDLFAAAALTGLLAARHMYSTSQLAVKDAVEIARLMVEELDKVTT